MVIVLPSPLARQASVFYAHFPAAAIAKAWCLGSLLSGRTEWWKSNRSGRPKIVSRKCSVGRPGPSSTQVSVQKTDANLGHQAVPTALATNSCTPPALKRWAKICRAYGVGSAVIHVISPEEKSGHRLVLATHSHERYQTSRRPERGYKCPSPRWKPGAWCPRFAPVLG